MGSCRVSRKMKVLLEDPTVLIDRRELLGKWMKLTSLRSPDQRRMLQANSHTFPTNAWIHKITKKKESDRCDLARLSTLGNLLFPTLILGDRFGTTRGAVAPRDSDVGTVATSVVWPCSHLHSFLRSTSGYMSWLACFLLSNFQYFFSSFYSRTTHNFWKFKKFWGSGPKLYGQCQTFGVEY